MFSLFINSQFVLFAHHKKKHFCELALIFYIKFIISTHSYILLNIRSFKATLLT